MFRAFFVGFLGWLGLGFEVWLQGVMARSHCLRAPSLLRKRLPGPESFGFRV